MVPATISLFFFEDNYFDYTLQIFLLFILSTTFFYIGYSVNSVNRSNSNFVRGVEYKAINIFLFFYVLLLLVIYSRNPPALFYILTGDFQLINELRAYATKGKVGIDSQLNFVYFTLSYALLPSYLLVLYYKKSKFRHYFLFLFSFFLMLNMQKARLLYLLIPLLFLVISVIDPVVFDKVYRRIRKKIVIYLVVFFVFLIVVSNYSGFNSDNFKGELSEDLFERSTTGARFLFSSFDSLTFVINRVIWISYITMVDWVDFFHTSVGEYLHGSTIPGLYKVFGHDIRYQVENEVFKYSYRSGEGSLGTANTHFILDAFVNFGYFGVIIYSLLSGFFLSFIYSYVSYPANYISYNYAYSLSFSSLHANFLGGGIWFICLIVIFNYFILKRNYKR